jgi:hypothetical protein
MNSQAKSSGKGATPDVLQRARKLLQESPDIGPLTAMLGVREQAAHLRRLAHTDSAAPHRGQTWRRLASLLFALAPARPRILQRATLFYIPDGKFQMQVFALDDAEDGTIAICCEDVVATAIKAGLLTRQAGQPSRYQVMGTPHALQIEHLDSSTESPPYCNAMTGWNRKALRMVLPVNPPTELTDAVELLCALSSLRWIEPPTAKPAKTTPPPSPATKRPAKPKSG